MKIYTTDQFVLPLPAEHRFPMDKYRLLRERCEASGWSEVTFVAPHAATDEELARAHATDYLERVQAGTLTRQEIRRIGFPWSPAMVERSRRSSGATVEGAFAALDEGIAVSLAGGTHHAFHAAGEGFCVFNDSVVAARALQAAGAVERCVVLDCDVHQGNGTAALCAEDDSIFTFSIHGARNFPYRKERSDLDLALDDGTEDTVYLDALEQGLDRALGAAGADLAFYLAGADPWHGDRWGRLGMTKAGLAARDRMVLDRCREAGLPVVVTMAGGYAPDVEDIAAIHYETVRYAVEGR